MFYLLRAKRQHEKESGFTLVELLVVILVIGILAAIAIPMFLNQRKSAVEASMQSDLKNAATAMEQESIRNNGKYPSAVPVYDKQSPENRITLDSLKSSTTSYCLNARNSTYPELKFSYNSIGGGLLKGDCSGSAVDGVANAAALAGKKALLVNSQGGFNDLGTKALTGAGITTIDTATAGSLTIDKVRQYDIIVAVGAVWTINTADTAVLKQHYAEGGKILTDGNDSTGWAVPLIATTVSRQSPAGTNVKVGLNPTYNSGLSPTFPYTFTANTFDSADSWQCTKTASAGVVVIADSVDPQDASGKCLTMLGQDNGSGRWVHFTQFPYDYSNNDTNPAVTAVKWLMQ